MRYYLVAGEASGDLHASHLIAAIRQRDEEAQFRFVGGDQMEAAAGCPPVRHYRNLAYMGLLPVLLHLRTIMRAMRDVQRDIVDWHADALILVDYPGFNLQLAHYIHTHTNIPTFYYIAPKIWAWKEWRIKQIRRDIDHLLSILPFEIDFFEGKHHYPITYVGNPTVDEIDEFRRQCADNASAHAPITADKPIIALLAGSRRQEIHDNLPLMLQAVEPLRADYEIILAAAPGIDDDIYAPYKVRTVRNATYQLLSQSTAALVTSGTATLETALFRVPQVVCYRIPWLFKRMRRIVLKIPFVSLVNLIAGREVVPELLDDTSPATIRRHLMSILPGMEARQAQLSGYEEMSARLGKPGAPQRAAEYIIRAIVQQDYRNREKLTEP